MNRLKGEFSLRAGHAAFPTTPLTSHTPLTPKGVGGLRVYHYDIIITIVLVIVIVIIIFVVADLAYRKEKSYDD